MPVTMRRVRRFVTGPRFAAVLLRSAGVTAAVVALGIPAGAAAAARESESSRGAAGGSAL
jgi:hypothetical protein